MRKLFLGLGLTMVLFLSTSASAWATCPAVFNNCVIDYFNARHFNTEGYVNLDLENVSGISYELDSGGSYTAIYVVFKSGEIKIAHESTTFNSDSWSALNSGYTTFMNAREALLKAAIDEPGSDRILNKILR